MASVLPFVRGVDFSRTQFKDGHFSDKVTEMSNLRWLRLNRTQLSLLPEEMDKFSKLEVLTITHNGLKELHRGNLPSILSLRVVNVSHNKLRDSGLPSDLFRVKDLATLDLSCNELTKVPEDLFHAKNIIVLSLSHNRITTIPGALFVNLSGVQHMDLSNNELQSLPPQLRRLEHLQYFSLANNPLQHWSFKVLDKLTNLTVLNLSNTGRDFTNTPHIDKLVNLTDIDLSHNELSRIPEPVYLLEKLRRVNVSYNCIKDISSLIDTWLQLVTLDLSNNQVTSLHPNICKCTKLKRLFLSNNRLTFEGIPAAVGKLVALEHFLASHNQLECIPEGLCRCYNLKRLILTSNRLLTLPEGIHFLKLEKLDIRDNPHLVVPPKPTEQVKGSGAEWYNIDFDSEILKGGAVVATAKVIPSAHHKRKERRMMMMRHRKGSVSSSRDEESARKVLKGLADVAEQRDVMMAGAAVEMVPDVDQPHSPKKPKRWDALLRRPDLDYSEIFTDDVGKLPGIAIWQIENFNPVEVEETFYGQFYMGDCYIVLKTDWNELSELSWEIYFWIGKDSTLDKRACAAMHAVHLRNMLGSDGRSHREEMGDESEEFEDVFPEGITYIEGGTLSGFYTIQDDDVPFRLYQLCGMKRPYLEPVDTVASSLDLSHVFLLDANSDLYIWSGSKSSLTARSKARLIAEKIKKTERKNKSEIHEIRAGVEPDDFWDILGGPPEDPIPLKGAAGEPTLRRAVMYKAGLGAGYLELPQVEFPQGQLVQSLLKMNDVYIVDCHSDIFVWIGRKSARLVRAAALRLAHELLEMIPRPPCALVSRCQEGTEPQIFKTRFKDWNDVLDVDYTRTPEMQEKRKLEVKMNPGILPEKKAAKVDLSPLFLPRQQPMPNREANELMMKWNTQLLSMRCCVLEGRKFSILPNREKGHFYSAECYFFLCRYAIPVEDRIEEKDEDDEDLDEDEEEPEHEIQTVVYFWQGRDAGNMGWLHFTLGMQKQLERAMGGPIDVIHVKQQQEDFKFLSHFGGKFIIHQGERDSDQEDEQPSLYQIRANSSKICRRVVQVPAVPKSLNSAFCHILKVPFENSETGIVYIWIGSQATQEEAIHAEQMGRTMFESTYSNVVIQEGSEPENFFWVALGGKAEYEKNADFMRSSRLFRCSNEKGFFAVSEKCSDFCQGDLADDDVMLLDSGDKVFVWFGANSTEIERKLAVKSSQVYLKHLQGEGMKRKLKVPKRGSEPWEFTRCFHGWVA